MKVQINGIEYQVKGSDVYCFTQKVGTFRIHNGIEYLTIYYGTKKQIFKLENKKAVKTTLTEILGGK